jgi:uncharacterized Zn finger protein (UPF0148 family)
MIKENMFRIGQTRMTEQLAHTAWAEGATKEWAPMSLENVVPAKLAKDLAPLREKYILEATGYKTCPDCNEEYRNLIVHTLEECVANPKKGQREELRTIIEEQPQILQDTMASLNKHDRVKVYLGLIGFETNLSDDCFQKVIEITEKR